jgi:SAM-dependent methyltransferase
MTDATIHSVRDKRGRLASLRSGGGRAVLEFGCGSRRAIPEAITVDALDYEAVDVVGDVFAVLAGVPDGSVDEVFSSHFVEHLSDLARLVSEVARVLKPGGTMRTVAPHFSNPYYYSDYTHRTPFGLYTFSYLSDDHLLRRKVPRYVGDTGFELVRVRLLFKAPRPFYVRYALRRLLQVIVNATTWTQEIYELGWCYWFPCYEVEYVLTRR